MSKVTEKAGTGKGRRSSARVKAREAGDVETADALAPPSEKKLDPATRCGARTQKGGKCQRRKGSDTDHAGFGYCSLHGGNTEAGKTAAMREMGQSIISDMKAKNRFGGNRHDASVASLTPEQALLEEVRRSAAMVRFLEERIAAWNLSEVQEATLQAFVTIDRKRRDKWGYTLRDYAQEFLTSLELENPDNLNHLPPLVERNPNTGLTGFTDAREWLYLYREERMHLAKVAKMAIDAGVAQRLVSIAEDQGRVLAAAIRAVLGALGLTAEQAALVPRVVPPVLRAVAQDQPIPDISTLLGTNPEPLAISRD